MEAFFRIGTKSGKNKTWGLKWISPKNVGTKSDFIPIYIYRRFSFYPTKYTIEHCSLTVHGIHNHFIRSHGTIHTFKNYFAIVFSIFSFQFSAK